jgi:folate-dependent phosphoribosylglycinamide formyltransferase PurN
VNNRSTSRIVLLGGRGTSTRIVYHALERAFGPIDAIIEAPVRRRDLLERRVKKLGPRKVLGQVLFQGAVAPALQLRARQRIREIKLRAGLDDSPISESRVRHVPSVNAEDVRDALRALAPAVVVVNGTRIISKEILTTIPARFINMHAGITPMYRGVHGGYWALAERERSACGVTVHLVDPGIDTGGVLGQALIAPTAADNFATYPFLQIEAGLPLLCQAVASALAGDVRLQPYPSGNSKLRSHPTLGEYLWNRVRHGVK